MKKSDVNGDNTNEVFKLLKSAKPGLLGTTSIKWNFTVSFISLCRVGVACQSSTELKPFSSPFLSFSLYAAPFLVVAPEM